MILSNDYSTERFDQPLPPSSGQADSLCAEKSFVGHRVVSPGGQSISPEALEQIEQLDDTVFAALGGDAEALDRVGRRWRAAVRSLDTDLINQSRKEYVRKAKSIWRQSTGMPSARLSEGFVALELLELLGDDAA